MVNAVLFTAFLLLASAPQDDCENKALVVDDHAEGVKYRDCWQVEYVVKEAFRAAGLLGRLTGKLLSDGWQRLEFDPFHPNAPDQKVHKWTEHRVEDQDGTRVDQWIGWFILEDESRVQVALQYYGRSPEDKSLQPIIVRVSFVSPEQWEKRPR